MAHRVKRLFDIFVSAAGLLLLWPLLLLLAIAVRFFLGSPILFEQLRPGKEAEPFTIYKFRSMTDTRGPDGQLLADADRLPTFGRFLRASSLDELPELWNVLIGEMSLVGPRPLLMDYVPLYSAQQARRMEVRPGITGWAQVQGRNAVSWDEKFAADIWYVDNRNMWLDMKILVLTVIKVATRDGVSAEGEATMPKFTGNRQP